MVTLYKKVPFVNIINYINMNLKWKMHVSYFMLISTFTFKNQKLYQHTNFFVQISIINTKWCLHHCFIFSYVTVVRYRRTAPG